MTKSKQALADRWTGLECYLDGQPARIYGRKNEFATIAQLNGPVHAEFAWETVDKIMKGTMEFSSR